MNILNQTSDHYNLSSFHTFLSLCLSLSLKGRGSLAEVHCCVYRPYKSRELTSGLKIPRLTSSQWKPWEHCIVPPPSQLQRLYNADGVFREVFVVVSVSVCVCGGEVYLLFFHHQPRNLQSFETFERNLTSQHLPQHLATEWKRWVHSDTASLTGR